MFIPIILAGGFGTRLQPLSSKECPKQFLRLVSEYSLLQETLRRAQHLTNGSTPIIVCNEAHVDLLLEQLAEINIKDAHLIVEPSSKNTAPAITAAVLKTLAKAADPSLLIMPADHYIADNKAFDQACQAALDAAKLNKIVSLGIKPRGAKTEYGYIKVIEKIEERLFVVDQFTEKPNQSRAEAFINSGNYYWNSGIFMAKARVLLNELKRFSPEMVQAVINSIDHGKESRGCFYLNKSNFSTCEKKSFDYAVMEKTDKAVMVPLDSFWSDLGSFDAISEIKDLLGFYAKNVDGLK